MIALLRDAAWLTRPRVVAYGAAYAAVALFIIGDMLTRVAGWREHPPVDVDYLSFHAAAVLAREGEAPAVWDAARHAAAQAALQGGTAGRFYAFFYPPFFLLICLPLAWLPPFGGFLAWGAATGAAAAAAMRRWNGFGTPALAAIAMLAPAAILNLVSGQNGFLTLALLAGAGLALDRRPVLAGALLATLAYKPQLGLLVIPALIAARRWRALGAAVAAGLAWMAATLAAFGSEVWIAFLQRLPDAGEAMASGALATWKLQSVAAMARTLGLPPGLASLLQVGVAAAVLLLLVQRLRLRPGGQAEVAAIAAGAPLVTPFVLTYDLVILLIPAAWLVAQARQSGWRPWEKAALAAAWALPGLSILLGIAGSVSLGPLAALPILAAVLRRLRGG